jgi:hypothetical protein
MALRCERGDVRRWRHLRRAPDIFKNTLVVRPRMTVLLAAVWRLPLGLVRFCGAGRAVRPPLSQGGTFWNPPDRNGLPQGVLLRETHSPLGAKDAGGPGPEQSGPFREATAGVSRHLFALGVRPLDHVDMSAVGALKQQDRGEPVVEPGQLPSKLHARSAPTTDQSRLWPVVHARSLALASASTKQGISNSARRSKPPWRSTTRWQVPNFYPRVDCKT